ncbi:hypothetical protein [Microbacterium kunmingense]|uniref:hypothetical protein n=1 Tax=Microbacterium kunmingense TaxID=2915939 RepID=UPI002006C1BB|nr:hypothetical protein [Microbacterium kunmingense]
MAVDTGGVEKSIQNGLIEPIEDAHDALEKLGDGNYGRDIERELDKAQDATEDLDTELEQTRKELDKLGFAAKDAGDAGQRGMRRLGDAGNEASGELKQNLGETFSSFRGDLEDIPQLAQDVFGGLAGSVGGLLPAFGLAAGAAGIGLLIEAFKVAEEQRKALEDRANDLATAYMEAGSTVLDEMAVMASVNDILTSSDQGVKDNLRDLTTALGDRSMAARALAGDTNALAAANELVAATDEEYLSLTQRQTQGYTNLSTAETQRLKDLQLLRGEVYELNTVQALATQNFQDSQAALKGLIEDAGTATYEVDELGNQLYTLPSGVQIMVDAKTGQATVDVSNFKGDVDGIPETVETYVKLRVDDSEYRRWQPNPKTGRVNMRVNQVV